MKYQWQLFAGWIIVLRPYILPFWLILIFLYSLVTVKIILGILKFSKKTYSLFKVSLRVSIISFGLFVLECALTHIFTTLMHFNEPKYGYIAARDGFGLSIYEHAGFFIFTLLSVFVCMYVSYRLNSRFTIHYLTTESNTNKNRAILLISILTSPLVFFITLKELLYILFPINW